jgi:PII-like signaling protein
VSELLQLCVYFGESDRAGGELLSDALFDLYEGHGLSTAILLRGVEGFGIKHRLRTQRLLTLSEDLPLVSIVVDSAERIEAALPSVADLVGEGLVTVERARALAPGAGFVGAGELKLTLYTGRTAQPPYRALVDLLRANGVAGATVLLGIDGMRAGVRRRARFLSTNGAVPLAVVSIGASDRVAAVVETLGGIIDPASAILERVQICKDAGRLVAEPTPLPASDLEGNALWQRLTVYAAGHARHGDRPLDVELVRRLRLAGAPGATALRGIWGYSEDHAPHGDRLFALERRVPVVTTVVDRPEALRRWWTIVDEVTATSGLVTSEIVPAVRVSGPGISDGSLVLARPQSLD